MSEEEIARLVEAVEVARLAETQSTFLTEEAVAVLTGRRRKSKQIEALRMMGLPFWINAIGHPIVSVVAIEGKREPPRKKAWVMPEIESGTKKHKKP